LNVPKGGEHRVWEKGPLTCQADGGQLHLVGVQELAVELDGLPAVVRLAQGVDQALEGDAEGGGRLEALIPSLKLQGCNVFIGSMKFWGSRRWSRTRPRQ